MSEFLDSHHFHEIISGDNLRLLLWEDLSHKIPLFPRGWYELCQLKRDDRIEFVRDFWLATLGATDDSILDKLSDFFLKLDDIEIVATQEQSQSPFEVHMIYSLKSGNSFQGLPSASSVTVDQLILYFSQFHLPSDYLAFLSIHDGFSGFHDKGLLRVRDMAKNYVRFVQRLINDDELCTITYRGYNVNFEELIPFYEAEDLGFYQCFCASWLSRESNQMGNVGCSPFNREFPLGTMCLDEQMSFDSFAHWMCYYLEQELSDDF